MRPLCPAKIYLHPCIVLQNHFITCVMEVSLSQKHALYNCINIVLSIIGKEPEPAKQHTYQTLLEIRCIDDCTQNRLSDFLSILMDLCILVKSICSLWSKTTRLRSRCSNLVYHWIYQCPDKFQAIPKSLDTWKQTALIFLMNRTYAFTCKTSVWSLFTAPREQIGTLRLIIWTTPSHAGCITRS